MTPTEQPEDLRAAIAHLTRSYGQTIDNDSRILVPVVIDEILALCEAAALAALPEKRKGHKWVNPETQEFVRKFTNYDKACNDTIATAQANIHRVFGGTQND